MKKTILSTAILFLFFLCNSYGQGSDDSNAQVNKNLTQANEKCIAHDYIAAIKLYDEAIALSPRYALSYYDRGIAKLNLADSKAGACLDFKKALELGYRKADEAIIKFCK